MIHLGRLVIPLLAAAAVAAPQQRVLGEVIAKSDSSRELSVRGDDGSPVAVRLDDATRCVRVKPGETDLSKAVPASLGAIQIGDRVLARGKISGEGSNLEAALVVVMPRADLDKEQERQRAEWKERGIGGRIMALDAASSRFTLVSSTLRETKSYSVDASRASIRRYPPHSGRFADTRPSTFAELRAGDQVRVLGEKSGESELIVAQQILAGAFRTFAAQVRSVDAAGRRLMVKDLATGQSVALEVAGESNLRRLSPGMARFLAVAVKGEARTGGRERGGAVGPGGPGAPAGGPPSDFQQALERAPEFALEELKPEDALIISGSALAGQPSGKAFTVVAGVEPLLTVAPGEDPLAGAWNFDINIGQ